MSTRNSGNELISPLSDPEKTTKKKRKKKSKNKPTESTESQTESGSTSANIIIEEEVFEEELESRFEEEISFEAEEEQMADENDTPMFNRTRTVAPTPTAAIRRPPIDNNFSLKGNHLQMLRDNQFDGRVRADPHKHIASFLEIGEYFKYGPNTEEAIRLRTFPMSLCGEAKIWYQELEPNTIQTWDQMREAFVSRYFPPALAERLLNEIRGFRQAENESLVEAWLRIKELLRNCHGHGLSKAEIIELFYNGLDISSSAVLDSAGGGLFMYKTPNEAWKIMEDKVLQSLNWAKDTKSKPTRKTVAFAEGSGSTSDNSEMMKELKAMSTKFDNQFKTLKGEIKELREGCGNCGGNHATNDCDSDDQPMRMADEDVNYLQQNSYQRGGYQNRNSGNFQGNYQGNRYSRQGQNYNNQYQRDNVPSPLPPPQPVPRQEATESALEKMMKEFISKQDVSTERLKTQMANLRISVDQGQKNQQASIQDLERKMDRLSEGQSSRPTGGLPSNTQPNPRQPSSSSGPKPYQPPPARNEHANAITIRS